MGSVSFASAQTIASFEITLNKPANGLQVPVSVNLDDVTFIYDSTLSLVEVVGNKTIPIPFQIQQQDHRILYWLADPGKGGVQKHLYRLLKAKPGKFAEIDALDKDGSLTFESSNKNLLRYQYKTVYPPAGIDTNYKRSGFIHPLWTPHGQELTRIQAPDHYHHYGIWNPWTHTLFEKDTVDFWNLKEHKGTVRFAGFASVSNGPIFSEFQARHVHVAFKNDGTEKTALNELQTVRVYKPADNSDYFIVDITSQLNCASESPLLLLAYRYGGLGWRCTPLWNKDNSEVLTSEGKNRKDADGSTARWCIVQGALNADYGGAVMLSYPSNYNHPEPLRIWPETQNGRGDLFANFDPTKDKDWLLEPGKVYTLKYRLVVFNGKFTKDKAESAWQYYALPPTVRVIK
jgi:hypothetical protein